MPHRGSPTDRAEDAARAVLFSLLERIVDRGLTPDLRRDLSRLPEVAGLLEKSRQQKPNADDDAADHQDLFGYRVHPNAGTFLDVDGRAGGTGADLAVQAYLQAGASPELADRGADHIGTEIAFLAHCARDSRSPAARAFMDQHLLGWLPGLADAVTREPYPEYGRLMELLLETVLEYRSALGQRVEPALPDAAALAIDSPKVGVREIAAYLTTPARCGFFIGRGDIARLGRESGVPRGFGGRALMLGNLLRSAAEYDRLRDVTGSLSLVADRSSRRWQELRDVDIGAIASWAGHWMARIEGTRSILGSMERQVRTAS